MLLEIDDLRVETERGGERLSVVSELNLRVDRGEVLGVIGESGAGKSTVARAAMGYAARGCKIARGRVLFQGVDLLSMPRRSLLHVRGNRIGYIAQSAAAAFNPAVSLNSQLCEVPLREGLMSRAEARERAWKLFERLLLPEPKRFGECYPHQVSGGELQRAMAAMAMMCSPELIILDEPTSALDVTSQASFIEIIRKLITQDGVAALYISHDLALISQVSTRILVMRNGRVEEEGPVDQVINSPHSSYARDLVEAQKRPTNVQKLLAGDRDAVIEVQDVTVKYSSTRCALDRVSLTLRSGETLAVVGESGSGKTTLARLIVGLLQPNSGRVLIDGILASDIRRRSKELRRRIQLVHQLPDLALNPTQSVSEIIGRPLKLFFSIRGTRREARIHELLETVGLSPSISNRVPAELSGGEKQRVCIARALAAEPRILLCDEVTASLDPIVARGIIELLDKLKEHGELACILITHDFGVVNALADRVAVLRQGRVMEEGPRARVIAAPKSDYTASLLAAVPRMGFRPWFAERPNVGSSGC